MHLCNHRIGTICWSLVGSPVSTTEGKESSPFFLNLRLANSLAMGCQAPWAPPPSTPNYRQVHLVQPHPGTCNCWDSDYNDCIFPIRWNFSTLLPIFWLFRSSVPPLQCSLNLRGDEVRTCLGLNTQLSLVFNVLCRHESLQSPTLTGVKTLPWLSPRVAFVYGYKHIYLDCSLVPCQFSWTTI